MGFDVLCLFLLVAQMAKKMKKMERECHSWKTRFDGCNKSLIDMVADVRGMKVSWKMLRFIKMCSEMWREIYCCCVDLKNKTCLFILLKGQHNNNQVKLIKAVFTCVCFFL